MSEEKSNDDQQAIDPFAQMIQFYDGMSKSWAKVMSDAVSSKSFAESMGQQMESNLEAMTLMRKQFEELVEQYLQQMSLPTRKEVINITDRLTRLEMALDDLDAKLDDVLDLLKKSE